MVKKSLYIGIFLFIGIIRASTEDFIFESHVIDSDFPRAYQVKFVDIDHDNTLDIAAVGEGDNSFAAWYANPSWKRHRISAPGIHHLIDLAFYDIDADAELEAAIAYDFKLNQTTTGGTIAWFDRGKDDEPWKKYIIHHEPTSHRLRWIDILGDESKELINVPVVGRGTKGPSFNQQPVRVLAYKIPPDPKKHAWPIRVLDQSLHVAHGIFAGNIDQDEQDEILIAAREGIILFDKIPYERNGSWRKKLLNLCSPEKRNSGASEIAAGWINPNERFLATIEPWHGNEVVVYQDKKRIVLDNTCKSGHAIACADLDRDGEDEIIAGYRGGEGRLDVFDYHDEQWQRIPIDQGNITVQGIDIGDVNQDGRPDIAAAGGSTNNIVLFLNCTK